MNNDLSFRIENLKAGSSEMGRIGDAVTRTAITLNPPSTTAYGSIMAGALGIAESYTTISHQEFVVMLGALFSTIGERLAKSAADYAELEAINTGLGTEISKLVESTTH